MPELTRERMVALVERLLKAEGSEAQQDEWLEQLCSSMPLKELIGLISWPERETTADEIVDTILAYKPKPVPTLPSTAGRPLQ